MAENKKSFVLYANLLPTVRKLTKEQAGTLFFTILEYVNDLDPEVDDFHVDLVFEPIKQQLKIDLKKWEAKCEKNVDKGRQGGIKSGETRRKKALLKQNEAVASQSKPMVRREADIDNDNVSDIVIVNDNNLLTVPPTPPPVHRLQTFIREKYPRVSQMKTQLEFKEAESLTKQFSREILIDVLNNMENKTSLLREYTSVHLTMLNWSKRRVNDPKFANGQIKRTASTSFLDEPTGERK